jgi:hypothetical protein
MPPGSSTTKLYTAIDTLWTAVSGISQRWVDRLTGAFMTLIFLASIPAFRGLFQWFKNRKKVYAQTKGFLDYKLEAETAMSALPSILGKLTVVTSKVGPAMDGHTRELANALTTERQIGVSKRAAHTLDRSTKGFDKVLIDYEATGATLVEGLDGWSIWLGKTSNKTALVPFIGALREFIPVINTSTQQIEQYISIMNNGKGASSVLNAGVDRHVRSLSRVLEVNVRIRDMCIETLRRVEALPES